MIVDELAYKVTLRTEEFLTGKKKIQEGQEDLQKSAKAMGKGVSDSMGEVGRSSREAGNEVERTTRKTQRNLKGGDADFKQFSNSAVRAFNGAGKAMAGFLGVSAGMYGLKQLFGSTATEITRASNAAKFFGSDVNRVFGLQRGFKQAGLNGDAFIGAAGSSRMALANLADPTVMGGLTGQAQNLITLGARTGLNVNELGDPTKALAEFTRYGQMHDQSNLMQVMGAAGFDPSDAAKIKSGDLKQLVDSETKKSNITQEQVKQQEAVVRTMGQLSGELDRLKIGLAIAFAPAVIDGMKAFGNWMEKNSGDIIGFFESAGSVVKSFTKAVGGAENALIILTALYLGTKIPTGGGAPGAGKGGTLTGLALGRAGLLALRTSPLLAAVYSKGAGEESQQAIFDRTHATWQNQLLDKPDGFDTDILNGPLLLDAIRKVESSDGKRLYSDAGVVGDYQFKEDAARDMGLRVDGQVDERLDSQKSREAAGRYIAMLLKHYKGNMDDALIAYNWGMGNVDQWIAQGRGAGFTDKNGKWRNLPTQSAEYVGKIRAAMGMADPAILEQYKMMQHYASMPPTAMQSVDRSQSSHININTVEVKTNPATVDALTESIKQRAARSLTNGAFASAVVG